MYEKTQTDEKRFLSELVEYMNKRYEAKFRTVFNERFMFYRYTQHFPLVKCLDGRKRRIRWSIRHGSVDANMKFPRIEGYLNGKICISSGYILQDVFLDNNPIKFGGMSITEKEKEDIAKGIRRRNNQQEFKSEYPSLMGEFVYGNKIAKEVSQETGIEVKYLFPNTHPFSTFFYSIFNSKKMTYDDKTRMIKTVLNAIDTAFEKAWDFDKLFDFFTEHGYRERKEYLGFEWESKYRLPRYGAIRFMKTDKNGCYFGLRDGRLMAFNRDMSIKWIFIAYGMFELAAPYVLGTLPLLIGEDGTLYFFSSGKSITDHYFYALNPDGVLKWIFKVKSRNSVSIKTPIFSNGVIYLTFYESMFNEICIYALSYDGTLKWSFKAESWIPTSPSVDSNGTLYFMSYEASKPHVSALGIDGNLKWRFEAEGRPAISPIVIGPDGTIYFETIVGSELLCLDAQKGEYADFLKYCIHALNPDGSLKWKRYEGRLNTTFTKNQKT